MIPRRWEVLLVGKVLANDRDTLDHVLQEQYPNSGVLKRTFAGYETTMPTTQASNVGLQCVGGGSVRVDKMIAVIKVGVREGKMPSKELVAAVTEARRNPLAGLVSVGLSDNHVAIAAYDSTGGPFPVVCFDRKTGERLWTATAWGAGKRRNWGAAANMVHFAEVVILADTIAVFGESGADLYVECFDARDGASRCRFSTNSWE
jgi:hypothetical protein